MVYAISVNNKTSTIKNVIFRLCRVDVYEDSLAEVIKLSKAKYIEINTCSRNLNFVQSTSVKLIGVEL